MSNHSDSEPSGQPLPPPEQATPFVPPTDPAAATTPLAPATPTATTDSAPAAKPFWRRPWVLITVPVVAAVLIFGTGAGIGWTTSRLSDGVRSGFVSGGDGDHGFPGGGRGDRGGYGDRGEYGDRGDRSRDGHRDGDGDRGDTGMGDTDDDATTPVPNPSETP
ncbi:hypothetical protein [Microbacterium sp.]|uniref:hypothetical protein n=1 Tax=Microbacterium sp. TaxID=51671 RepID=UPI003A853EF3